MQMRDLSRNSKEQMTNSSSLQWIQVRVAVLANVNLTASVLVLILEKIKMHVRMDNQLIKILPSLSIITTTTIRYQSLIEATFNKTVVEMIQAIFSKIVARLKCNKTKIILMTEKDWNNYIRKIWAFYPYLLATINKTTSLPIIEALVP